MSDTLLKQLQDNLDEIYCDASEIEVLNHSNTDDECVTVYDMKNPDIARNNCAAVSYEVHENMMFSLYVSFTSVEVISIDEPWIRHYAICFTKDDEEVVLDFTARQFNPNAPLLMVLPRKQWEQWLKSRIMVTTTIDSSME